MIFVLVLGVVLFLYSLYEYTWFKNVMLNLPHKDFKLNKKRIIFLSDLQYDHKVMGFRHYAARKLIREVNALEPDLVIIGGDIIHKKSKYAHLIFNNIAAINCDVVAILGNHDFYDLDLVLSEYERIGVHVLRNEVYRFDDIQIVGIEHPVRGDVIIPEYDHDVYTLVVSHGPDVLVSHSVEADFMLAGHLHGGQVTLFGIFAPITNSVYKQKYLHGMKTVEAVPMYVSSGLGGYVWFLPIRFFARPEIVVLDF